MLLPALAGKVKAYPKFSRWAAEVAERPRPADPLRKRHKAGGASGGASGSQPNALAAIRKQVGARIPKP